MAIDFEEWTKELTSPFDHPQTMGKSANTQLQFYHLAVLEAERRYFVIPPILKSKQQQPFWTKDWRRNGRKH